MASFSWPLSSLVASSGDGTLHTTLSVPKSFVHTLIRAGDLYVARRTRPEDTPLWLSATFVVSNLFLNSLNIYWFAKMVDSLRRRAEVREHMHEHED
jgi:hypothetical protein